VSPRVSIIIPTLDEGRYLPGLLASIRRQTMTDFEILVADSGSTDGTVEVAAAEGVRVLPGDRKGPGEGRNRGAKVAAGEVFVFTDADCILPPNLLEVALEYAQTPGVVGGASGFMPADGRAIDRLLFWLANAYQRAMTAWGFPHNAGYCFFFRRDAWERLGGIREEMLLNETHDIAFRSRAVGRFVSLPVTVHTSMRRFRRYGYAQTILREYVASTLLFYLTGRTPSEKFRPKPAR